LQGSAATYLRQGDKFYFCFLRSTSTSEIVKELSKLLEVYQSFRKKISGTFLWLTVVYSRI